MVSVERLSYHDDASDGGGGLREPFLEPQRKPITEFIDGRVRRVVARRRNEYEKVLREGHLLIVANDEETRRRMNYSPLVPISEEWGPASVLVNTEGDLFFPKWVRHRFSFVIAHGEEYDLILPKGKKRIWERQGRVNWKTYSPSRVVSELITPRVVGCEDGIRYCEHITESKESGQMLGVLNKVGELTFEALRRRVLQKSDLEGITQLIAVYLVNSGLSDAVLPEKQKIMEKLLLAAGFFSQEGKRNLLGVMMRFFSARLIAELRLDGIVPATRVKYRMNAELVRFDRERTRALLSETADRRIEMLISNFSLFDDGKRKLLTSVQKREQVRSIVANLAGWSKELREDVKVKPYKASVTMVAIRFIGGSFSRNDQERWEKILGEEGVRKALGERIIPLFGTGREEDYQKARQLLVDSQALLRKILEEHKDIYPEKS